ncbi:MAG: DMT family transporter [Trueperaceae bacterium]|nr:DMT family transporter [Trueperaceae bacterium]
MNAATAHPARAPRRRRSLGAPAVDAATVGAQPRGAPSAPPAPRPLLGLALMLGGMVVLPVQDGLAKYLSQTQPVDVVVWARYTFHLLFLLPLLALRVKRADLVPKRPGFQVLRAVLMLVSSLLFFGALARLPLVDVLALFFVSPLVVTALVPVLLRERIGWRRVLAVVVGFVGVLVLLRPGLGAFEPFALVGLAAGVVHGVYLLVTRKLAGTAPPLVTLTYSALFGAVLLSAWVLPTWAAPSPRELLVMVALGAAATLGHYLVVKAFDHAPAAWLAPVGFAEIVGATLVGFVAFGDLPDAVSWLGIAVIVGSGLYISLRERRLGA